MASGRDIMGRIVRACIAGAVVTALGIVAGGAQASAAPVAARWSVNVAPASAVTGPEVGGGRVYVGFATAGGTGGVRALDVNTGRTLWTRTLPLPVAVTPVYVPANDRLYTAIDGRVFALNAANGKTVVAAALQFTSRIYSLHFADGRLYVQTIDDVTAFTPNLAQRWNLLFNDDSTVLSAPGDGFLYWNDEGDEVDGFIQCLKKFDSATGRQVAKNCGFGGDFIVPTAVPSRNAVVGGGEVGVYGWRTSNLTQRWLQQFFPSYATVNASEALGGRAAVVSGEWFSFLRLNDGSRICEKRFDERNLSGVSPAFDPTSGAAYVFDSEQRVVYKASANCKEVWRYLAGTAVIGFDTNSTRVFGAGGRTVFALDL
jgi:outer membrane protein assembly factor BamB